MLINGKVAVITGIGPGMGKAIALLFARNGAKLAIGARSTKVVDETAAEIRALGGEVITASVDLSKEESCRAIVAQAAKEFGGVDIIVQNAAVVGDYKNVEDADPAVWRHAFEANVMGPVYMYKEALPYMKERGDGRIILINSGAGNNRPRRGLGPYGATKAALASLVRSIAVEGGVYGIRCNGIHLGAVDGELYRGWVRDIGAPRYNMTVEQYDEMFYNEFLPLRYIVPAEEYAGTVLFLASELSRPITGQAISVNGGEWMSQ
jgi:NAD(P)-dependent dehydrogenase (short-subunit alcohol dehydrogenase family)